MTFYNPQYFDIEKNKNILKKRDALKCLLTEYKLGDIALVLKNSQFGCYQEITEIIAILKLLKSPEIGLTKKTMVLHQNHFAKLIALNKYFEANLLKDLTVENISWRLNYNHKSFGRKLFSKDKY